MVVLIDLYEQKLSLFRKLGKVSEAMTGFSPHDLAKDDEAGDQFLSLLDERMAIMGKIDVISHQILSQAGEKDQEESEQVRLLKRALQEEMERIQAANQVVEAMVKNSLHQLREQARKLQEGRQSNRAYAGRAPNIEGSFIDKRR